MKTQAFKAALPHCLPVCAGFLFIGMSYGVYMSSLGFSFVWPMVMSVAIFAGSMEFLTANLLVLNFDPDVYKRQVYAGARGHAALAGEQGAGHL